MENNAKTTGNAGSQSDNAGSDLNLGNLTDMLGNLNVQDMLHKYGGPATKMLGRLTTTQKIVGGALLFLGARYLSKRAKGGKFGKTKKR